LITAAIWAMSNILIKMMSTTETPHTIVFYMLVVMTPISLPFAMSYWTMPTPEEWGWLVAMAIMSNIGQICLATAISKCDMAFLSPFDFARLIFVSAMAYFFFDEDIDPWTILGAIIITISAAYSAHRESKRAGEPVSQ